jgi:hypothetical protein
MGKNRYREELVFDQQLRGREQLWEEEAKRDH